MFAGLFRMLKHVRDLSEISFCAGLGGAFEEVGTASNVVCNGAGAVLAFGDEVRAVFCQSQRSLVDVLDTFPDDWRRGEIRILPTRLRTLVVGIRTLRSVDPSGIEPRLGEERVSIGSEDGVGGEAVCEIEEGGVDWCGTPGGHRVAVSESETPFSKFLSSHKKLFSHHFCLPYVDQERNGGTVLTSSNRYPIVAYKLSNPSLPFKAGYNPSNTFLLV